MTAARASLASTLPPDVLRTIEGRVAVEVGFGAGPGFAAQMIRQLAPTESVRDALERLERYRDRFRRAHIRLDDGSRLLFEPTGFIALHPPLS